MEPKLIKGLQPSHSQLMTAFVVLFTVEFVGFAGYVGGFYDEEGGIDWLKFQWDASSILYTILMLCSWMLMLTLFIKSKEEDSMKIGASIFVSLPVALFCLLFIRTLQT